MNIKDVKLRKGMKREEVNELVFTWIMLEDSIYMGNRYPHNWRCKCGNIIENRMWSNIKRRTTSLSCLKCNKKLIEDRHRCEVEKTGEYEYIKTLYTGDKLPNGEISGVALVEYRHKYCGFTSINKPKLVSCSKCCKRYENSFAHHIEVELGEPLEKYWDFEKNTVNPYHIYKNSKQKVWIKCTSGRHHYSYAVVPGSFTKGHRCNRCANRDKNITISFAQYHIDNTDPNFLDKYWDWEKNTVSPWEISPSNSKKIWIKCQSEEINELNGLKKKNYHKSYLTSSVHFTQGNRCPYCNSFASKKVHKLDSFGYYNVDKLMNWHPENLDSPFRVSRASQKKRKFVCYECGNEWEAIISNINKGKWCPHCKTSKGEKKIKAWLDYNNIDYIHDEPYFNDLIGIGGGLLRPDFILPDYKIWIEYDGEFHYRKMYDEDEYKTLKIHDKRKDEYAKKHGWKLIRIPYICFDKIEDMLEKSIYINY